MSTALERELVLSKRLSIMKGVHVMNININDIELIGLYDHVELHVGQFTLPIDAGCLNEERTAFRKEALAYIGEMLRFPPHLSDKMRNAVVEGFIKNFCLYRY